ncbi:hypothetical protein R3W88_015061 [Solanum pinnatisectum]|uniref:RNase H type-1 domain-containing protein n=1 Tax=Solanum pinnatisectum TaxID=50273 RepID=A0AAV9KTS9_9SOLN|nr:hypothetical protein R3W88_015061 [Solanum pinnatisectum]
MPVVTLYCAKDLEEWKSVNLGAEMTVAAKMITKLERPLLDIVKCNTDVSYDINTGLTWIGMVLRGHHLGQLIIGKTLFLGRVASPLLAEIIGVHEALSWLKERFIRTRLVVETDNLLVKQE